MSSETMKQLLTQFTDSLSQFDFSLTESQRILEQIHLQCVTDGVFIGDQIIGNRNLHRHLWHCMHTRAIAFRVLLRLDQNNASSEDKVSDEAVTEVLEEVLSELSSRNAIASGLDETNDLTSVRPDDAAMTSAPLENDLAKSQGKLDEVIYLTLADQLTQYGLSPAYPDAKNGRSLIFDLVESHAVSMVKLFIERGEVTAKAVDQGGSTTLHYLTSSMPRPQYDSSEDPFKLPADFKDILDLLISHGADPLAVDEHSQSIFDHTISKNRLDVMHYFLEQGMNPNAPQGLIMPPLHHATSLSKTNMLKLLLSYDENLQLQDPFGNRALYTIDRFGNTALHVAADDDNMEIAKLLVSYGADLHFENHRGHTPAEVARLAYNTDLAQMLDEMTVSEEERRILMQATEATAEDRSLLSQPIDAHSTDFSLQRSVHSSSAVSQTHQEKSSDDGSLKKGSGRLRI